MPSEVLRGLGSIEMTIKRFAEELAAAKHLAAVG